MRINIKISSVIFIVLFFFACSKSKIDKQIVLKIGKVEITNYEFEKSKNRTIPGNHTGKSDRSKKLAEWKKKYLEKYIIIADAYEMGYDTISEIQKQIKLVSKFMVVQQYGYLWQKTVSPIVDEFKQVTEAKIEKRKKIFYFDFMSCNNLENLLEITDKDTVCENLEEYTKLKNKCYLYNSLSTGYISQQWPFLSFWNYKDYLFYMKEGEVSPLLTIDGNYVFLYLDHVENIDITQKDKANLQTELQLGIEKEIDDKKTKEIELNCKPVFYEENIGALIRFISEGNKINEFKNNLALLQYNLDDTRKKLDFATFLEYYIYLPMKPDISDKKTLIDLIHQYYYDDYLNSEAKKLGIYKIDTFLLDQKMFKNGVIYGEYIERNIIDKMKIDSSEILDFYNKNKSKFTRPKTINVDMYVFNKAIDASDNIYKISDYMNKNQFDLTHDTSVIKGLHDFNYNFKIDLEMNKDYSEDFLNKIVLQKTSTLSDTPIKFHNKYVLLYKKGEEGQSIWKLKNVYAQIESIIKMEKLDMKVQELVCEFSKKYKIEIDKTGIE